MSKPTHIAYVVAKPKKSGDKNIWRPVGVIWAHEKGNGFDLVIHNQLSISGRIVCMEAKEKSATEQPTDQPAA